ncbi:MAG: sugar ABC transporter permease [Candidatus Bathyarchaeia archaeon]|jgi:multiple sugar transport system permease protein
MVKVKDILYAYSFVLPALIIIGIFILVPVVNGVILALQNVYLIVARPLAFVGLQNFVTLFGDEVFWIAAVNTLIWTVVGTALTMLLGIFLGLVLNVEFKLTWLVRGLMLLPWILPDVVVATEWKWMLNTEMGIANQMLVNVGIIHKISDIQWLSSPNLALLTTILIQVWRLSPLVGLLVLATLQGIPREHYEAAEVDGASSANKLIHITLPNLLYVVIFGTLLTMIWLFNSFGIVFISTEGGPIHATEIFATLIYKICFQDYKLSVGAALGTINFIVLFVISVAYLLVIRRRWGLR